MPLKATNNATSLLSSSIDTIATVVSITAGDEAKFPVLAGDDWFPVVVVDAAGNREIMRCTARSGINLTVFRGQEGTVARAFTAGARVDMRLTAAAIDSKADTESPIINDMALTGTPTAPTPPVGDRSQQIATTNFSGMVPAGAIIFGVMATPAGYLQCNGTAVSRTTYAALFAAIATTFGAGDGVTTFTLPDLRGQFIRGADAGRGVDPGRVAGSTQAGQLQSHAHTASSSTVSNDHTHSVNIVTDAQGNHQHAVGAAFIGSGTSSNGGYVSAGSNVPTTVAGLHQHNVSGNTGGISANHTHAITVDAAGAGAETRPTNIALHGFIKF